MIVLVLCVPTPVINWCNSSWASVIMSQMRYSILYKKTNAINFFVYPSVLP